MEDHRERECITAALESQRNLEIRRLRRLQETPIKFESPLHDFGLEVDWRPDLKGRMLQVAALPLWLVLLLVLALAVPFAYASHLHRSIQSKKGLAREIARLDDQLANVQSANVNLPATKTVEALWRAYGLDARSSSVEDCLSLLNDWLSKLYDENVTAQLNLEQELNAIRRKQVDANLPYYRPEEGAAHFLFVPPFLCLLSTIAKELPHY